jgi:hypothetical protein
MLGYAPLVPVVSKHSVVADHADVVCTGRRATERLGRQPVTATPAPGSKKAGQNERHHKGAASEPWNQEREQDDGGDVSHSCLTPAPPSVMLHGRPVADP